jgi:glycosyltransferase involved in cell wall biosynthesis
VTMLSVVIPVFDEASSLRKLHTELSDVTRANDYEIEVIFIDDGSTDQSWPIIESLAAADPRVHGIRFRRNFGKAAALSAGFGQARGELVVTLDADLQDDPQEIPGLRAEIAGGYDVVSGWKKVRHDPWHKVLPSRVFNWMISSLTGVVLHDHNCGMKCYRREALEEIDLYGELHRFIPVLAAARGFRVGERVIEHRPREFGHSKYGVTRFMKGFLDLLTVKFLTGFGHRPLHLLGSVGLISFFLGLVFLLYLAGYWLASRLITSLPEVHLHDRPALYYSLALFFMGLQFMSIGFVSELITAYHGSELKTYSIAEQTGQVTASSAADRPSDGTAPTARTP